MFCGDYYFECVEVCGEVFMFCDGFVKFNEY